MRNSRCATRARSDSRARDAVCASVTRSCCACHARTRRQNERAVRPHSKPSAIIECRYRRPYAALDPGSLVIPRMLANRRLNLLPTSGNENGVCTGMGTHAEGRSSEKQRASTNLISVSQAAERLGVSKRTLQGWIAARRIPVVRLTSRCVRIRPADVDRFVRDALCEALER